MQMPALPPPVEHLGAHSPVSNMLESIYLLGCLRWLVGASSVVGAQVSQFLLRALMLLMLDGCPSLVEGPSGFPLCKR